MRKRRRQLAALDPPGLSRRGFLASVGAGAVGAAVAGSAQAEPAVIAAGASVALELRVNGQSHQLPVEPRHTLLQVLRERLGLTGTKPGCERGECGACTVLIDGVARYACQVLALEAQGCDVTTIEGLMEGENLGPLQKAFVEEDAFQCGYCTPGQVMAAAALLRANPAPTLAEIRLGMSGNLCRCGAYSHVFRAVQRAAGHRPAGER